MSSPASLTDTALTDTAILGELLLEEAQVDLTTPGHTVVKQFEQRPRLPGVVVTEKGEIVGLISRRQLYEGLSQPYALEIFLRRPIRVFLDLTPNCCEPLILSYQESVQSGVRKALSRPAHVLFEPIIVLLEHPQLPQLRGAFMLDFHTLVLAHTQISAAANQTMLKQQQQLLGQQAQLQAYAEQLEVHQQVIAERNRQLEHQQHQMMMQSQSIQALNHRFMQIGAILSEAGKKAFQATFAGVNAICQNTDEIMVVGQQLEPELTTIEETSRLIEQVSRQVHHLSVQAAIFANQACNNNACVELEGFGYITEEISHLSQRTSAAGRQIKVLGDRFRDRISTFQAAAQDGTVTARSLIREIEQAAIALSELENLVSQTTMDQHQLSLTPLARGMGPLPAATVAPPQQVAI